jgi:hypothetical protein
MRVVLQSGAFVVRMSPQPLGADVHHAISPLVCCSFLALSMCAVTPADGVSVTCAPPDGKWPTGSFTVDVTATGGPEGCKGTGSGSAKVTVDAKATITVALSDTKVCDDADKKTLAVTLTSSPDAKLDVKVEPTYCVADKTTDGEHQAAAAPTCLLSGVYAFSSEQGADESSAMVDVEVRTEGCVTLPWSHQGFAASACFA